MSAFTRDEARYDALILERLAALRARPSYRSARRRCLGLMGRREAFASLDDWVDADRELQANDSAAWWEIRRVAAELAEQLALFPSLALCALMVKRFSPRSGSSGGFTFPIDFWFARARLSLVGPVTAPIARILSARPRPPLEPGVVIGGPPARSSGGNALSALRLELELPLEYPPVLAVAFGRHARKAAQESVRGAGLDVPHRVRRNQRGVGPACSLITYKRGTPFVKNLRAACLAHGISLHYRVGKPSVASSTSATKAPLAEVRLLVVAPIDVQEQSLTDAIRRLIARSRDALRDAGVDLGQRSRTSSLARRASSFHVTGRRLPPRGIYPIIDGLLREPSGADRVTEREANMPRQVKSRRHAVGTRLRRKGLLPGEPR